MNLYPETSETPDALNLAGSVLNGAPHREIHYLDGIHKDREEFERAVRAAFGLSDTDVLNPEEDGEGMLTYEVNHNVIIGYTEADGKIIFAAKYPITSPKGTLN